MNHSFIPLKTSRGLHRGPLCPYIESYIALVTRQGESVDGRLPVLSTYLGHADVTYTYWYLSCTPELMAAAGTRLERRWKGLA